MKYELGGSLFQIAVAAIDITILINKTKNDPTRAFRAFPNKVEIAKERDMAVFIHIMERMTMGPGFIETISRRKAAAIIRNIVIDIIADNRKST